MLIFFLLIPAGCVPIIRKTRVLPDEIDNRVYRRLAGRKSFAFNVAYHTDAPVLLSAHSRGVWQRPDREAWDGFWIRGGQKNAIRMRANGDVQFFWTDSGWQIQPRGLESKILDQLEQLLADVQLSYRGEFAGRYRFQFQPNMSLIDPLRQKNLSGILDVDIHSGLPVRVYVGDPERRAEWEARFSGFDRKVRVEIPFVPVLRLELAPERRLRINERRLVSARLQHRLRLMEIGCRQNWEKGNLELVLDQVLSRTAVELLTCRGQVELWRGRWVKPGESAGGRVVQAGIDAARRVELLERLGDNSQLQAEVDTSIPLQPKLTVTGRFAFQDSSSYILLADQRVLGVTEIAEPLDAGAVATRLHFSDSDGPDILRTIQMLFSVPPLPVSLRVISYERR
uniref:Uncharacterized protein n=1 Tax=candidate division WOR-3 bacterium TaxID=2052148 RepID=A0A7C3IXF6_UNCW3